LTNASILPLSRRRERARVRGPSPPFSRGCLGGILGPWNAEGAVDIEFLIEMPVFLLAGAE